MIGHDSGAKTVAVLGLGEAGALLARDLVRGGAVVRGWDPDFHGDLSEIPRAASAAAAIDGADIVISVNWATVAADVAREALPHLHRGMIYADHNTSGPKLKEELAAIVAPTFYRMFGTPVGFIGTKPGEANARKLCRSVFFKGMSSSIYEALEAARAVGVEGWLRSDITRTLVEADASTLDRIVDGTEKHAVRRGHEMRDAEAMLRELGTAATMVTATAESLERIASEKKVPALR
jgi:3-hydroxyisobutyrate dehydrogenase-like beta-hydroxyacid dehydrogenase